jgi:G6PDH family F420-dependent oxidoreductase
MDIQLGYALSSEEHGPSDLVRYAARAEEAGFTFALISDHYHPWIDRQGNSPFVWSVLGGIAGATSRLRIGTGVTCPTMRIHPAIIAQAAATIERMMPGRFFLGVGTGENLNEHVTGARWPNLAERQEMLEEAIEIIRSLWTGEEIDYEGHYYRVQDARLYTAPEQAPPIHVAASGEQSARFAGRLGDGLISTSPNASLVEAFQQEHEDGGPRLGQVTVCWARTEDEARRTAREWWPTAAVTGELTVELPLPRHFEQASRGVTGDDVAKHILCGPDPERHLEQIRAFAEAGFDHVYVHQVGPDQEGFFRFYAREVQPALRGVTAAAGLRSVGS